MGGNWNQNDVLVEISIQEIVAVMGGAAVEDKEGRSRVPRDFALRPQSFQENFCEPFIEKFAVDESIRLMADVTIVI
jgi:hypothetical protein